MPSRKILRWHGDREPSPGDWQRPDEPRERRRGETTIGKGNKSAPSPH
jgi:hypothetical protein